MKVLLDTATLVAAMLPDHVHHGHAFPWLARGKAGAFEYFASGHSLAEVYSVLTAFRGLHVSVRPMHGDC